MNKSPINTIPFSAKRPVILTLALIALLGVALPIYSSTRASLESHAIPAVHLNSPQNQPAAMTPQRTSSPCPRDPICCLCGCC